MLDGAAFGLAERGVSGNDLAFLDSHASLVMDEERRLVYASRVFERLVGFDCQNRVGQKPPHPWWPPEDTATRSYLLEGLAEGAARGPMAGSFAVRLLRSGDRRSRAVMDVRMGWPPTLEPPRLHTAIISAIEDEGGRMRGTSRQDLIDHIRRCAREIASSLELLGVDVPESIPFDSSPRLFALSPRERELVSLILADAPVPKMAETLSITRNTVRNHVRTIYRKLGVHSRGDLVRLVSAESVHGHPKLWIQGATPELDEQTDRRQRAG